MRLSELYKNQLIRYGFVAGMNVVASYGVFAFLIFLNLHYIFASTLATFFGILFGFKNFSAIVFNNKNNLLIFKYLIVWVIVYIFNIAGLAVFNYLNVNNYVAGLMIMFPAAGLGFLLNKKFAFKHVEQKLSI